MCSVYLRVSDRMMMPVHCFALILLSLLHSSRKFHLSIEDERETFALF